MDVTPYVEGMRRRMAERAEWERQAKARAREVADRVAQALARLPHVRRVFLYGSMAYHHIHQGSDIDIAVEGATPQDLAEVVRTSAAGSPFPLDVCPLEGLSEPFRKLVTEFGELLYDRSRDPATAEGRGADRPEGA